MIKLRAETVNGADLELGQTMDIIGHYYKVGRVPTPADKKEDVYAQEGTGNLIPGITKAMQKHIPLHADRDYQVIHPDDAVGLTPQHSAIVKAQTTTGALTNKLARQAAAGQDQDNPEIVKTAEELALLHAGNTTENPKPLSPVAPAAGNGLAALRAASTLNK